MHKPNPMDEYVRSLWLKSKEEANARDGAEQQSAERVYDSRNHSSR